jgi:hypothetical protein
LQAPSLGVAALPPQLTVIIRDDDISACTRPEILHTLYGELWAQRPEGRPVCLAVVPFLSEHVPRLAGYQDPDPGVWPFLRHLAGSGRAEIALHGYRHAPGEWAGSDSGALRLLLAYRLKQWLGRPGFYPVVRRGSSCLFAADTYLFTPNASPAACLRRARRAAGFCARFGYPLIIVNHHWHFFHGAGQPRPGMLAAWHEFVAGLSARNDVTFTTFAAGGAPW